MKKIALFVALVVIFGGLYTYVYLTNSKNINANTSSVSTSKTCECEDPEQCKAEGKCDGECEEISKKGNCSIEMCQPAPIKASEPLPYTPPCCKDKVNK